MNKTLLLSQKEVQEILSMGQVISTVKEVFKAHGEGQVVMPAKITLDLKEMGIDSWTNAMPAFIKPLGTAGIKWAGGYINNHKVGLPYVVATIILQNPHTGVQTAIMDGAYITNLRTGAVAGVVAEKFAKKGASKVAIIGSGTQGRTSLDALTRLLNITEVKAYDKYKEAAQKYADDMSRRHNLSVVAVSSAEEAVKGADIVITATPSDEPIVKFQWLSRGSVSISLGSYQEFDDVTPLKADKVFVDSWAQCRHRGELVHLVEKGLFGEKNLNGEIGSVFAGKVAGRTSDEEIILTVPIGLGSHDIAVAKKVYDEAQRLGKGTCFELT